MWMFVFGLVVGIAAKSLWDYKSSKGLKFSAMEYLAMAVWTLWVAGGLTFVIISVGEYENRAASLGGLIFGVVALAGLVLMRARRVKARKGA